MNLAGEPLPQSLVQHLYERSPIEKVYNLYGPSEDTTYSTYMKLEKGVMHKVPSIGRPISNTEVYVLSANQQMVPKCTDINYHGIKDHLHFYIASYFIVGRIVEGKQELNPERIDSEPRHQIYIPKGFPKPIIQLDCVTLLPWVIDEPYE
ncbi:AMP-binding protein [Bacillus inaquosorum]|nr:AMP-binding protein [Bacillus inaquosorum]WNW22651.1 AMP-binding protein [Bacillus inaquosorum]